jgi:hypothetical protein
MNKKDMIQISEDVWIDGITGSGFIILMIDEEDQEQIVELVHNEITAIKPHLEKYLKRCEGD